ncbi:MAG: hypothetical protein PHC97_01455 [Patescibacteria group bacterium]|nr:hypothetical protein [Patescibacteria group bacterium]
MNVIAFLVLLLFYVLIFARLEAEIEGEFGWAAKLPTARYRLKGEALEYRAFASADTSWVEIDRSTMRGKFFSAYIGFLGGKDFTWYHRVVDLLQLFVAHLIIYLCFGSEPKWVLEVRAVATLFLIWSLEDTFYFFVNPRFGFKKYNPESIGWHKDWLTIGGIRIGDKGMMGLLAGGAILFVLSLFLHWLVVNVMPAALYINEAVKNIF